MATRRLLASIAASAALHAGAAVWLQVRVPERAEEPLASTVVLSVSMQRELPEAHGANGGLSGARYYTSREVDIKATPLEMRTRPRTNDNFPFGRIATAKLRLFISEEGRLDAYEILEAERLPNRALLDDFRQVRFRPAERAGRPVKSQKIVEISFVP